MCVCLAASTEEYALLQEAQVCSKSVLAYVNQAVKDCENMHKLDDLQRRMDRKQIENSNHPLVADYKVMTWNIDWSVS